MKALEPISLRFITTGLLLSFSFLTSPFSFSLVRAHAVVANEQNLKHRGANRSTDRQLIKRKHPGWRKDSKSFYGSSRYYHHSPVTNHRPRRHRGKHMRPTRKRPTMARRSPNKPTIRTPPAPRRKPVRQRLAHKPVRHRPAHKSIRRRGRKPVHQRATHNPVRQRPPTPKHVRTPRPRSKPTPTPTRQLTSAEPSSAPSEVPSAEPTPGGTEPPTLSPTEEPTPSPTPLPTPQPTFPTELESFQNQTDWEQGTPINIEITDVCWDNIVPMRLNSRTGSRGRQHNTTRHNVRHQPTRCSGNITNSPRRNQRSIQSWYQ